MVTRFMNQRVIVREEERPGWFGIVDREVEDGMFLVLNELTGRSSKVAGSLCSPVQSSKGGPMNDQRWRELLVNLTRSLGVPLQGPLPGEGGPEAKMPPERSIYRDAAEKVLAGEEFMDDVIPVPDGQAKKHDTGKARFDLIPPGPMEEIAKVFTVGAAEYGDRNWEKGLEFGRIYGAVQRHLQKWWGGEEESPDHKCHHLAHAAWGCICLLAFIQQGRMGELDTRPSSPESALGSTETDDVIIGRAHCRG